MPNFTSPHFASFFGSIIPSNDTTSITVAVSSSTVSRSLESQHTSENNRNKLEELTYGMSQREIDDMNPIIQILHLRQ